MHSSGSSVATALQQREAGVLQSQAIKQRLHFPEAFISKLCLEDMLRGHMGCVNRLAWNQEGDMLASCSDDRRILLWNYPKAGRLPLCIETLHQANIFGVAVLPEQNNRCIVSGSMDYSVQLHRLDHNPLDPGTPGRSAQQQAGSQHWFASNDGPPLKVRTTDAATSAFNCHKGRVKTVDVEPGNPNLFWSASEDGSVRQFDLRLSNQREYESPNVLLTVQKAGASMELLAAKLNKVQPQQIAVAANDPFVRLYDRRMLSLGSPDHLCSLAKPVLKMAPPHMCLRNPHKHASTNATYVSFGARGDKLLATYHADHAYAFDVTRSAEEAFAGTFPFPAPALGVALMASRGCMPHVQPDQHCRETPSLTASLSDEALAAKNAGNRAFFDTDDCAAIRHYTKAIYLAPGSALLYSSRAAAYLKRGWVSDSWAALEDCESAIRMQPTLVRAHCRRIAALISLGQLQSARQAAGLFSRQFPSCTVDMERIEASIEEEVKRRDMLKEQAKARRDLIREQTGTTLRQARADRRREEDSAMEDEEDERALEGVLDLFDQVSSRAADDSESEDREGWLRDEDSAATDRSEVRFGGPGLAGEVHRVMQRYVGHANVVTDIKEATFLGGEDKLVAVCSDDGHVFIYDAVTGDPVQALKADEDVVNCVQPHPSLPVLATSGIENVVRLWHTAGPPRAAGSAGTKTSMFSLISHNQERLKRQWSLTLSSSITPRFMEAVTNSDLLTALVALRQDANPRGAGNEAQNPRQGQEINCRVS